MNKFINLDEKYSCSPNPCKNGAECILKLLQIECICPENFFGKNCEFSIKDSELVYSQYSTLISDLKVNLIDSHKTTIDELNSIINQYPWFATKSMTDKITNFTCK